MKKICFVLNYASHYNAPIFRMLDDYYSITWHFGDDNGDIKVLDPSFFKGGFHKIHTKHFGGGFYYQKGVPSLIRQDYNTYVILGETRNLSTWLFLLRSKFHPHKKVFLWSHGWYGKENFLEACIKKVLFSLPSGGVILYGFHAKQLMVDKGFDPNKLFVRHNSLNHDRQVELRNEGLESNIITNHFKNDYKTLIFIGRLTPVKKLDMLIYAIVKLREKGHNYNLVFVGNGSETSTLQEISLSNNLQGAIWFYGECYDEKTNAELIYNSDLCVAPGNIGLTAMHSLVFGTPAISHDNFSYQMPEYESIIPGVTGDFFKFGDTQSLADTIQNWFDYHTDRETVRTSCYKEIDNNWTPEYQFNVFKKAFGD